MEKMTFAKVNDVKLALRDSGCFNRVNVVIDSSSAYAKSSPNGVQVLFELDEKRLNLSTNTGMDFDKSTPRSGLKIGHVHQHFVHVQAHVRLKLKFQAKISTKVCCTIPNVLGRGESISFNRE